MLREGSNGVSGWLVLPARKAVGTSGAERPTVVKRDDCGVSVHGLDRRGKTWPSALWAKLGEQRARAVGLPAQALVEHELGHGCRGVLPVGQGPGRLLP